MLPDRDALQVIYVAWSGAAKADVYYKSFSSRRATAAESVNRALSRTLSAV